MLDDSGVKTRPYQAPAIDFLVSTNGKGAVRAATGAGKTVIALKAVVRLGYSRILILVPRYSAILPWKKALRDFKVDPDDPANADKVVIVQRWTAKRRRKLYEYMLEPSSSVEIIIMLYATAVKDKAYLCDEDLGIDTVLGDESHKAIRNRRTLSYAAVKRIAEGRKRMFFTATAQSKGPQNLFTTLQILSPRVFTSYWAFVGRYCVVDDGPHGKEVLGVRKSTLPELKARLQGFIYNIPKRVLKGYVPERIRKLMPVETDRRVRKVYDSFREHLLAELPDGSYSLVPSVLAKFTKLRQLLTCPAIIHPAFGVGNGFLEVLDHAQNNTPHVVIISEFTEAFDHWSAYLKKKRIVHFRLQGGMTSQHTETVIGQFSRYANSAKLSVLLLSLHFAESFDLLTPDTAYLLGYAWDQNANYQAEGRLTRGDKDFCTFYYVCHDGLVDMDVLELLDRKKKVSNIVVSDIVD